VAKEIDLVPERDGKIDSRIRVDGNGFVSLKLNLLKKRILIYFELFSFIAHLFLCCTM
jgi:hypothetical protein